MGFQSPHCLEAAIRRDCCQCRHRRLQVARHRRLSPGEQQIQKLGPNLPTGTHQLERAAGYRYYFESDSVACYNSFILAPGTSREALAIWTPIGLVPTHGATFRAEEFRYRGPRPLPQRCQVPQESGQLHGRLARVFERPRPALRRLREIPRRLRRQ